ncbi:hypothetical protein MSAN_02409300 [Mycena sanguinolenta]|uniref:Uncharacterized protein n=1 Tax=Mycena sanguinolenta TaxID=230812 RepID=A0A8H6X3B1_9AGAR|nr:hypothetical protein MSAN_02409300 [Mycena sanguinolenta]
MIRIAVGMHDVALVISQPTTYDSPPHPHIEASRLPRAINAQPASKHIARVEMPVASRIALTRIVFCSTPRVLELASRVRTRPAPYLPTPRFSRTATKKNLPSARCTLPRGFWRDGRDGEGDTGAGTGCTRVANAHGLIVRTRRSVSISPAVPPLRQTSTSPPAIPAQLSTQSTTKRRDAVGSGRTQFLPLLSAQPRPPRAVHRCVSEPSLRPDVGRNQPLNLLSSYPSFRLVPVPTSRPEHTLAMTATAYGMRASRQHRRRLSRGADTHDRLATIAAVFVVRTARHVSARIVHCPSAAEPSSPAHPASRCRRLADDVRGETMRPRPHTGAAGIQHDGEPRGPQIANAGAASRAKSCARRQLYARSRGFILRCGCVLPSRVGSGVRIAVYSASRRRTAHADIAFPFLRESRRYHVA